MTVLGYRPRSRVLLTSERAGGGAGPMRACPSRWLRASRVGSRGPVFVVIDIHVMYYNLGAAGGGTLSFLLWRASLRDEKLLPSVAG